MLYLADIITFEISYKIVALFTENYPSWEEGVVNIFIRAQGVGHIGVTQEEGGDLKIPKIG